MCLRCAPACSRALESPRHEDRGVRQAGAGRHVVADRSRVEAARPLRRGRAEPLRRERGRGGVAPEGEVRRRRGRGRLARAGGRRGRIAQGARDGRRPRAARLRRRSRGFRSGCDEPRARRRARAGRRRPRPVRAAGFRFRRRCVVGRRRRSFAPSARLAGRGADGERRVASCEAADGVRLRRDRRAAPGGDRGLGCDQRAALSVAEGDHGCEEEAARHGVARRPRRRRVSSRRSRLEDDGRGADRSTGARGLAQDRRRRERGGADRRVPRGEATRMSILVFLEHHGNELQKGSLGVLAKAASLGDPDVHAVVAGSDVRALASEAGKFGAAKVFVAEDASLDAPLPQPRVDVLAKLVRDGGYDAVFFANSVLAADVAAGLSARLDAGLNWDLTDVVAQDGGLVGKRPALQDSIYVEVGWKETPRLALFRSGSFDPTTTAGGEPQIEDVTVELEDFSQAAKMVEQAHEEESGPSIEDADVVVAGGRGLGSPEAFSLAEELAKALGGAVGATRAVVDAGWYPYAAQVGQTGKVVSPKLYVALGISGAIQHKVGMQSSNVIVAINKDPNAPIFEFSDLGVVGDLHQIVPKLAELVRQRRSSWPA